MATEFLTAAKQQVEKLSKADEAEFTQWNWPGKHWLESLVSESNKNPNLISWNKWVKELPDEK